MKARMFMVRLALLLLFLATIELERRHGDDVIIELYPAWRKRKAG